MCVGLSVCVYGWVAKEGILSSASLKQCQILLLVFLCLSILARRPHKEQSPREPARPELRGKRTKDVGQLEVGFRQ